MHFSHARKGVNKIIIAQVFAILATVLASGVGLILPVAERLTDNKDVLNTLLFMISVAMSGITATIVLVLMAVFSFFGYGQAAKDEAAFKKSMICALMGSTLTISGFFVQIPNDLLSTLLTSAGTVVEMFMLVYAVSGVMNLAVHCGQLSVTDGGRFMLRLLVVTYLITSVNTLIIRIFELSEHAWIVSIVIGAINSVLELLRYAFYLRYLRQCAAMLAAYDGEAEDE